MVHDWTLLIRNALLFEGTGSPPCREDVAVAGRAIAARDPSLDPSRAARVVDAAGQRLMPGLLDIHTHLDLEVELEPGTQADLVLVDPAALRRYDTDANRRMLYREIFEHDQLVNRSDGLVTSVWIAGEQVWDGRGVTTALGSEASARVT